MSGTEQRIAGNTHCLGASGKTFQQEGFVPVS